MATRRVLTIDALINQVSRVRGKTKGKRSKFFPSNTPVIKRFVPGPADDTMIVVADCKALTDKTRDKYEVVIMFHDVGFAGTQSSGYPIQAKITGSLTLYMQQPSRGDNPVSVTCTCADYYFTWWWWNKYGAEDVHALVDFPRYIRKTTWYPPRNPGKVQGVCKHIKELAKVCVQQKIARR